MIRLISILSLFIFISINNTSAQCSKDAKNSCSSKSKCAISKKENKIKVYYFHATRRCATCQAVEQTTKDYLKESYGNKISFESINREQDKNNPLLKKYKINGQTLLIVGNKKEVNLTNTAFLNARNNPDKLKSKIKSTIESMK
ncbi:MAG: nitrophenyl compound nitroreductase subunit ArsF family protein [Bacteroidales bacterium]